MDLADVDYVISTLKLLGCKGTTGTQASFKELFNNDQEKLDRLDPMIAAKMGFDGCEDGLRRMLSGIRPDLFP